MEKSTINTENKKALSYIFRNTWNSERH